MIEIGEKFGKWTVTGHADKDKHGAKQVVCKCECGTESTIPTGRLTNCKSRMCLRCARNNFRIVCKYR